MVLALATLIIVTSALCVGFAWVRIIEPAPVAAAPSVTPVLDDSPAKLPIPLVHPVRHKAA